MTFLWVDSVIDLFVLFGDWVEPAYSIIKFGVQVVLSSLINEFFIDLAEFLSVLNDNH